MKNLITIGLPSKGRLKEGSISFFEKNNLKPTSNGGERNYFAQIENLPNSKINRVFKNSRKMENEIKETLLETSIF